MIDPMSSMPLLALPLPLPRAAAVASFAFAFVFSRSSFSRASSRAFFAARLSLQSFLCPDQAFVWHATLQYDTSLQPEHVLNVTPFPGLLQHSPHRIISG